MLNFFCGGVKKPAIAGCGHFVGVNKMVGLFPAVFQFGFFSGLPLHVGGVIGAAAFECLDVVNDVTGAWPACVAVGWAWVGAHEGGALGGVALGFVLEKTAGA